MTNVKKPFARQELEHIEDALIESLLNATDQAMQEELSSSGDNLDQLAALFDHAIAAAQARAARERLSEARVELAAWRENGKKATPLEKEAARARLSNARSGRANSSPGLMMAARKGKRISESDDEGLFDDLAELEKLEQSKIEK